MTIQTPASAEIEKLLLVRFFYKFLTPDPGPKEKSRIQPESTPVLRVRSQPWCVLCKLFFG